MSASKGSNTRLAYSTGGDVPREEKPARARVAVARAPGIRLRLDRRASGRVVTVVTGLPGTPAQLAALAGDLRAACGAGGTVKDRAVELQGDHRERIEAFLSERGLKSKRAGG
ncbi:MAG: translation initiation factor [Vicinamibacteria bacterium]